MMSCQELKKMASGLGENVQRSLFIVLSHKVIKLFNLRYFNSGTKLERSILTKNRFDEYNQQLQVFVWDAKVLLKTINHN